jgi:type IV pilus assembly protein PilC
MAEFVVKLADERGHVHEQIQSAANADEVRQRLAQGGYHVLSVKTRSRGAGGKRRANLETFLIFNQQFLTLIRAGLPILGSLDMLAKSQKNPAFAAQLTNVAERVRTGQSISGAFEAQGGFDIIYTVTLLAGERSGNLGEVLERFLSFQRISLTFRKKLKASLIYPILLIVLVFALFIFLITFVVPRFAELYDQVGTKLPWITLDLLAFGKWAQHWFFYVLPVVALAGWLVYRWSKTAKGADTIDGIRIKLPVFGSIWLKYQVALFARTLSTLLTGGLPLVPSLETAEGKGLSTSLNKTGVFPALSTEMIEVGESTGALPQMLTSVAEFFEEDVQTALTASLALIEPVILILMGVVVVVILIALYLPIFSLGNASNLQQ